MRSKLTSFSFLTNIRGIQKPQIWKINFAQYTGFLPQMKKYVSFVFYDSRFLAASARKNITLDDFSGWDIK